LEEANTTYKDYRTIFILSGYISGMAILGLHTWITLKAFFSESKSVTIYVNRYGEQFGDIITFIFFWIICLIGLVFLYNKIRKPDVIKEKINN